jgi:hypothetical protein
MAVDGMGSPPSGQESIRRSCPWLRGDLNEELEKPAIDWDAVRRDYEGRRGTTAEIARRYGTATKTLSTRATVGGWVRRNIRHSVDRSGIIARMFRVLERQIIQLEKDMTQTGEKEVAVLGKLASTLEKLIDIDTAAKPQQPTAEVEDMKELRNKLAQRIAQLKGV